jgi:DNA polymerase-3 subunit delta'
LLPTIRSRCVAVPVGLPAREGAEAWLRESGVPDAGRWLAFAGGAPLRAQEYASGPRGQAISRLLKAIQAGGLNAGTIGDREEVDALSEVLQKFALDQALMAFGAEPKYATGSASAGAPAGQAYEWLAFARTMGRNRALVRHPLNPRLFAAEMIAGMPARRRRR